MCSIGVSRETMKNDKRQNEGNRDFEGVRHEKLFDRLDFWGTIGYRCPINLFNGDGGAVLLYRPSQRRFD